MPTIDPEIIEEWFQYGDMDRHAAAILLHADGPLPVVAFHVQQTAEKYLKGYLLAQGWPLKRIHDLNVLLQEAISYNQDFRPFLPACQRITEYYIELRYPIGTESPLEKEALQRDVQTIDALISLIRQDIPHPTSSQPPTQPT